ncbi:synaptotagmin-4 [Nematostella vectensis]|uniref:synaptotagmin-4 n=1 Tax=Nematostella vectensis TaxID=45351 RepID=UPI0020774D31|nr:synaptotagmin-4 [Nematostella vectensis]
MEWGAKVGLYVGVALTFALFTAILVARFLWQRKQKPKNPYSVASGILGQVGISHHAPEFTIPLMVPLLIQDSFTCEEEPAVEEKVASPLNKRRRSFTWQGTPIFVQPTEQREDSNFLTVESSDGPLIRRLQSITDLSMFPGEQSSESRTETPGPWTSGVRRESLFFSASGTSILRRPRSNTTESDVASPVSPISPTHDRAASITSTSSCENLHASITTKRIHTLSTASTDSEPEQGRRISQTTRSAHLSLRKMTSMPDGCSGPKPRPPLKKRFSEIHRRTSSDSLGVSTANPKPTKPLPSTKRGKIMLTIGFNEEKKQLVVHLVNAVDLPMKNNNLLDSFVRLHLSMPMKQHRLQSKVHKKTCNPIYDEKIIFEDVDLTQLLQSTLRLKVTNKESGFTRGEVVGEALIFLSDKGVLRNTIMAKDLLPKSSGITEEDGLGEVLLSVCHYATSAQVKAVVHQIKDLAKSCKNPTISIELTHKGETIQKQQTRSKKTKKNSDSEEFNFHIPTTSACTLDSYSLQFSLFNQDLLRGAVCIGYVVLGQDAPFQSEVDFWRAVVNCPHEPITEWHKFHKTPY